MSVNLSPLGGAGWQFFDNSGNVLSGGQLYTYSAGTTTPLTTYQDATGTTANANPVVLDAAGRVSGEVWLSAGLNYKFVLKTSTGTTLWTADNISGGTDAAASVLAQLAASGGSNLIGFLQSGTGAVATTVQTKLRETVSVKDFGAVGDGVTDDTAAIQAALNSFTYGGEVLLPPGGYLISSTLTISKPITLRGTVRENQTLTRIFKKSTLNGPAILITGSNVSLQNFALTGQVGNLGNGITILQQYWELRNITVSAMQLDGIRVGDSAAATNCNIGTMIGVVSQVNGRNGFYFDSQSTDAGGAAFINCFAQFNTLHGFSFARSQLNTLVGCVSEANLGYGLYYDSGARDIWWYGGDSEANTLGQFFKDPACLRCNVQASWVSACIGARVYSTVNRTIPNATSTAVIFDGEYWDTDAIHDNITNATRLTCTTAGKYIVQASIQFDANATGERNVGIKLNGSTFVALDTRWPTSAADSSCTTVSTVIDMNVGDYVECYVYQTSGGALDVQIFNQTSPVFSMIRQN